MKAKLTKITGIYTLLDDNDRMVASDDVDMQKDYEIGKLSTKNCNEIFGVVDVDGLARKWRDNSMYRDANAYSYKAGFNKAMELNKDKVFTEEQMFRMFLFGHSLSEAIKRGVIEDKPVGEIFNDRIKSLQQPTEIEVEVITEEFESYNENLDIIKKPILDSEGCLILKKI